MSVNLYRFQIELSDVERAVYETLDFRVAQHPSEGIHYMLTRVIAFALNSQEDLAFAPTGLHDPDAAAISVPEMSGGFKLLVEIGSPSAKKLHKATKVSKSVKVYTYKNPELMMRELKEEKIHRGDEIAFYSVASGFLDELAALLRKDNRWGILFNDGLITVEAGGKSVSCELVSHSFAG